jgi:SMODS-associating 2TM, beta-strand rich effector domain
MLHPYATDSNERIRTPFYLAALAIAVAFGVFRLLIWRNIVAPWWIEIPSPTAMYFLFLDRFSESWWRWKWVRRLHLAAVPDLAGRWSGYVKSSYDDFATQHPVSVDVVQTWTKIDIRLSSGTSKSYSRVASLMLDSAEGTVLSYQFLNEPVPGSRTTMQMHFGTAWVSVAGDLRSVTGEYYSGRGRREHGSIFLTRE